MTDKPEEFDPGRIGDYRVNNRIEAKSAAGGIPNSIWETYSAFANTDGGVIILGAEEKPDGTLSLSGVKNPDALLKRFWDTINNHEKSAPTCLGIKTSGCAR